MTSPYILKTGNHRPSQLLVRHYFALPTKPRRTGTDCLTQNFRATSAHEPLNLFWMSGILKSTISMREWGHGIISEEFRKWIIVAEPVAMRIVSCSAHCCGFPGFPGRSYPRSGIEGSGTGAGTIEKRNRRGLRSNFSASNAQPGNLKPYWPRPGNSTPE